ncbi:MAG: S-adenosyl-l-methionine hydroxide adenosyltransferase family protein [Woeseia sp.]
MKRVLVALVTVLVLQAARAESPLVFQSDFGTRDSAVAAMKGVAVSISAGLPIFDLTHEIPPYSIWEASLRLVQAAEYWPAGTVFVSVVDPGVGTDRKSVVMLSRSGHYFVTPDNGTLTFVAEQLGVAAVREIDEAVNRLANSEESYTFHGRDVYAYTGARLAAGIITFDQVGRELPATVVAIPYQQPLLENGVLKGNIPILDIQYGNVWTNIDRDLFAKLNIGTGDLARVVIRNDSRKVYEDTVPYHATFGAVDIGEPLMYLNSLNNVSLAINQENFAETHGIDSGASWTIEVSK